MKLSEEVLSIDTDPSTPLSDAKQCVTSVVAQNGNIDGLSEEQVISSVRVAYAIAKRSKQSVRGLKIKLILVD